MAPFKAIIVGGSISGLVLANIFEQYNIDYVLLEKYEKIAPQLGAGFAIWPNGARVLEQLGCFEGLLKANKPVETLSVYDMDGNVRDWRPEFGRWMQAMLDDQMRFMERRDCVQGIWDGLKDKSKVHTSTPLRKISCHADGVTAEATNGEIFHGDILIGADGVHSRVRQEMQRIAAEDKPGYDLFPKKEGFDCTYSAIFGISKGLEGFSPAEALRTYAYGRSFLACGGPNGIVYWIFQFRNEDGKTSQGENIPRYTQQDQDRIVEKFGNDQIIAGVTLSDLMKNKMQTTLVPLEEGVHKTCHYRRMVLVGDSWHKIHPISGLGGNSAILSAASLGDQLHAFAGKENPSEASLEKAFKGYETHRKSHAQKIVEFAHNMQISDALETSAAFFVKKCVFPWVSSDCYMNLFATMMVPSVRLKHLPLPPRVRMTPFQDEVTIKPGNRPVLATLAWLTLLAVSVWLLYPLQQSSMGDSTWETLASISKFQIDTSLYFHLSMTAINSIMCLESYRKSFAVLSILGSAIPFGFASLFVNWSFVLPVYFGLFIIFTATKPFYYPSARALDLAMVQALAPAYLVTYLPSLVCTFLYPTLSVKAWTISHVALPFVLRLSKNLVGRLFVIPCGPEAQYGKMDLPALTSFLRLVYVTQLIVSLLTRNGPLTKLYNFSQGGDFSGVQMSGEILLLEVSVLVFFLFSLWDFRRVHPHNEDLWMQVFQASVAFALSPTAALAWFWKDREVQWEEARQKKLVQKS